MQTRQTSIINWIWLVWFYFISYTQSAFWHHLWIHITLSIITFFWYHISLDVFWKLNFSIHILMKDKVQTCKTSVINGIWLALFQLNCTQPFEIIYILQVVMTFIFFECSILLFVIQYLSSFDLNFVITLLIRSSKDVRTLSTRGNLWLTFSPPPSIVIS